MQIPVDNPRSLTDKWQKIPRNFATTMPEEEQKALTKWIFTNYAWPQIQERRAFEDQWDRLYDMYKIQSEKKKKLNRKKKNEDETEVQEPVEIGDTLLFDTVDRLKNLNSFVSFKDDTPVRFTRPKYLVTPLEDQFYSPTSNKLQGANGLLDWNNQNQNLFHSHLVAAQHFYLYGLVFALSDYVFKAEEDDFRGEKKLTITNVGITFEPTSIRKVWLNYRLPLDKMELQPCPFYFNLCPRFIAQQNVYDPMKNPMGYANLDRLGPGQYLLGSELESWKKAMDKTSNGSSLGQLLRPEFSTEAIWTFHAMVPITEDGHFNPDPTTPLQRFIIEIFSANLSAGDLTPVRIQKNFYPKKLLPIYGVSHIPDLDSGAYTPSIGEILECHYDAIVKSKNQFLKNKDWINDPPVWVMAGSPAANDERLNEPGHKIEVVTTNDFGWRTPFDATQSSVGFMTMSREEAKTSGKAVDAILGKAMGSRTTATEASNAFQAAMSGATTDINIMNNGLMVPYADRVWWFSGAFMDNDLIKKITGQYGQEISAEDMNINMGISRDVGSSYIESIVRQQHLRYAIEAGMRSPVLDQTALWTSFFQEIKLPEGLKAIQDNGFQRQVTIAYNQCIEVYLDRPCIIDPSQDHKIAIEVKTRFLQDHDSNWNTMYAGLPYSPMAGMARSQIIAQQIQIHQQFIEQQMKLQMLQQQMAMLDGMGEQPGTPGIPSLPSSPVAQNAGMIASMQGGQM